jgi:AmmeMemoRadiSam system protein B
MRRWLLLCSICVLSPVLSAVYGDQPAREKYPLVYPYYSGDIPMWNMIFREKDPLFIPEGEICAAIMPHHDLMILQISRFWQALAKGRSPSVVVLVSPDHFEKASSLVVIPRLTRFETPAGVLAPDVLIASALLAEPALKGVLSADDAPWPDEHGIFMHTPFISRFFPHARFVPVLVKPCATEGEMVSFRVLAESLSRILPPDALVVASVDFSHYQIKAVADLHDSVSESTILNGEDPRHLEVDSPESLTVVTRYAQLRGARERYLALRTSSAAYNPDPLGETTSHQYWAFYSSRFGLLDSTVPSPFAVRGSRDLTILIGGSGNPGAGVREYWRWDRYKNDPDPAAQRLSRLAGKEARFLSGFDALVFDPPPGSDVSVRVHDSILRVRSLVPSMSDAPFRSGKKERNDAEIAVLEMSLWPDDSRAKERDRLIADGVDVVIERDSSGWRSAVATISREPDTVGHYDLGVCYNSGHSIQGTVLALDWNGDRLSVVPFDYSSSDGLPPAIHQFAEN